MIRGAGAKEVHLRISSPPTVGPCHYGIDTPTREELIAANHTNAEIRDFVEADSVGYLSIEGLYAAVQEERSTTGNGPTGAGPAGFCDACFTNRYPVPIEGPPRLRQLRLIPA